MIICPLARQMLHGVFAIKSFPTFNCMTVRDVEIGGFKEEEARKRPVKDEIVKRFF